MANVRRVVLDILKPHEPSIIDVAQQLSDLAGTYGVNISIYEIDRRVENAKVTIEGDDVPYHQVVGVLEDLGVAIHSIDEVVTGKKIIEPTITLQD